MRKLRSYLFLSAIMFWVALSSSVFAQKIPISYHEYRIKDDVPYCFQHHTSKRPSRGRNGAIFMDCGTFLTGSNLQGDFSSRVARYLRAQQVVALGSNFELADLTDSDFEKGNFLHATFTMANLTRVNFTKANLWGAKLQGAKLTGVRFDEANLEYADLRGVDLSSLASWQGLRLKGTVFSHETKWPFPVADAVKAGAIKKTFRDQHVVPSDYWTEIQSQQTLGMEQRWNDIFDKAFRFDPVTRKCLNSQNQEGLNRGILGQCGDFRGYVFGEVQDSQDTSIKFAPLYLNSVDLRGSRFDGALFLQEFHCTRCLMDEVSFEGAKFNHSSILSLSAEPMPRINLLKIESASSDSIFVTGFLDPAKLQLEPDSYHSKALYHGKAPSNNGFSVLASVKKNPDNDWEQLAIKQRVFKPDAALRAQSFAKYKGERYRVYGFAGFGRSSGAFYAIESLQALGLNATWFGHMLAHKSDAEADIKEWMAADKSQGGSECRSIIVLSSSWGASNGAAMTEWFKKAYGFPPRLHVMSEGVARFPLPKSSMGTAELLVNMYDSRFHWPTGEKIEGAVNFDIGVKDSHGAIERHVDADFSAIKIMLQYVQRIGQLRTETCGH